MKCTCLNCGGTGRALCEDCDGKGLSDYTIETLDLGAFASGRPDFDELLALQNDCKRLRAQRDELCRLNPDRSESYTEQLSATLQAVNAQAEKLWKKGGK